ncbi:MAG: ABC transporter substrate-binding protein [Alphaproteobacteria bacterium]|nr:ABC transporter substrate-binding protein [Alphaproteobacteria bacterium]
MRVLLAASAVAFGLGASAAGAQQVIKIGVVGPMTGAFAAVGQSEITGAEMRAKEINAAGGKYKIELVTEDDASNCDQTVNATVKLITKDNVVAVLGAMNSPCALAMVPITRRYKTPQFTAGVGTSITKQGSDYVFRIAVGSIGQTRELAAFAIDKLGQSKFAVIYSDDEYGASMANGFKDALAARGMQPLVFDSVPRADQDFTGQLTKIKASGATALFTTGAFTFSALMAKQAKQLGMSLQLLGDTGNASPKYIELGGDAVEGAVLVEPYTPADPDPKLQAFTAKYKQQYGRDPDGWVAEHYDAVEMIHQAVLKSGKIDRQTVRDFAASLKAPGTFRGILGDWTFDATGDASFNLYKVQIKGGQKVILAR